jgi:hypothetical protein
MLLEAWKIKQAQDFDILASGEVLGQRPLSQTKKALDLINRQLKKVDPEIEVLRPLSAQRLVKTYYEQAGLVQREQLGSIEGRNRKQQLALAQELGLAEFPTPSGGCLLTVPEFGQKLKLLLECNTHPHPSDFELLKIGRHFWLSQKDADRDTELDLEKLIRPSSSKEIVAHLILGRNKEENQQIWQLQQPGDFLVEREDLKGPTALLHFFRKNHQRRERVCNPVPKKEINNQTELQARSSYDAYPEPFLVKTQELIFRFSKSSLTDWRDLPCKTTQI